ncbi:hypothetical protein HGRIS_001262 [Hohenbuehelia grisea]|uniref:Uncharacterized protein n=1 Tax=Hohenbuehelia grisea TaxID=104357 RepID=A0ABR3JNS9_9AGAR
MADLSRQLPSGDATPEGGNGSYVRSTTFSLVPWQQHLLPPRSFIHSTAYHYGSMPLIPESDISVGISVDKVGSSAFLYLCVPYE